MKKIAIIGASYLQMPLIERAKELGLETHVFAWKCGDLGEKAADYFYPISIVEKENILAQCREIGIDGICTIATDLGVITVNYVAAALGLPGNSEECTRISTNKHLMRRAFELRGDPTPRSYCVSSKEDLNGVELHYPVIVKPTDRSGSRGITKLESPLGLDAAIAIAVSQSFEKKAVVEEFILGQEYSVECISFSGEHHFIAMTQKFTTGSPHFIETGHLEPAQVNFETLEKIKSVVFHALDSLKITTGASHTELKINSDGEIKLVEIGGRMGGDFIGSNLVPLSTGIDFVEAVIQTSLGEKPDILARYPKRAAGVRFIFNKDDIDVYEKVRQEHPEYLVYEDIQAPGNGEVTDSSTRYGAFIIASTSVGDLMPYLPENCGD